ncbi:TPA: nucleoside 2-deoxyribosyltransferase [Patescibacteria group bacterium]|jgi:nucleoside 2-deoxyribosyltransferase|nr:nucleoside 2-deoxyribosyltransferase [Patescibacteria group bacterium]
MKIYFAGSITGGRADQGLYLQIIEVLNHYGEVLTEHIGDSLLGDGGEESDVFSIFNRDVGWLESSDMVVAEVTQVSMGVGYELGIAEKLGKKVICLYRPQEKRISAMVLGNKAFTVLPYETIQDLQIIFEKELS